MSEVSRRASALAFFVALAILSITSRVARAREPRPLELIRVVVLDASGRDEWGVGQLTASLKRTLAEEMGEPISGRKLALPASKSRDPLALAAAGRAVGADYALQVVVSQNGWLYRARAVLINCETGEIQMDFRSDYFRPLEDASDRGRRIGARTLEKISTLLAEGAGPARTSTKTGTVAVAQTTSDANRATEGTGEPPAEDDDWSFVHSLDEGDESGGGQAGQEGKEAFIDSSVVDRVTRGLQWHGHFQTYSAVGVRGGFKRDFVIFDNRLQLDLESTIGGVHVVARPQFVFNWLDRQLSVRLREIFAARYFGAVDFEFGERIVAWGVTDFYPVADIVNPRDFSSIRRWWPIDEKVAVPMAILSALADPVTIQLIAVLLSENTKFELDPERPFAVPVSAGNSFPLVEHEVPRNLKGVGGGGKIDLQIADWTLSTYALLGRNPSISVYVDFDPSTMSPRTNIIDERLLMAAVSVQGALDPIQSILRAEGAYYYGVEDSCKNIPMCFFLRQIPTARTNIGLERKIVPELSAQLQFITELKRAADIDPLPQELRAAMPAFFPQHTFNPIFTLRLQGQWLSGDFRPSTFFYISLADEDFFVNTDLEYYLGDNFALSLGGIWFQGYSKTRDKNRYTPVGSQEDSSHAYLRVTAWY